MTDRRLSDSTLDAMAAAPPQPLADLIADHRYLYRLDVSIDRMTTETPPVHTDLQTGISSADPMSKIGPTLSYPLERFISGAFGGMFPWSRALAALRAQCRRTHRRGHLEHEAWRGSLCHALVTYTVIRDYRFDRACFELYVTPDRAERVLRSGFTFIEQKLDDIKESEEAWRRIAAARPLRQEAGPAHHIVGGLHDEDPRDGGCPHPVCVARRMAA